MILPPLYLEVISQISPLYQHPMRSITHLRTLVLLWLAFCLLELHAFPFPIPFFGPYTSQQDIDAINDLYVSLGSPALDGWAAPGGDPCKEAWQGVQCLGPNITAIELGGAGLGGKLSETLGKFTAITRLDLSNNRIGGAIPQGLPPAVRELDLSSNNLSGKLPDSMAKLNSLSTLHVQNNQLTGTLDVLGNLPLKDLNVENNLFSGQIPEKLLGIPKFLRNGNHFTIPPIPASSPTPATPPLVPSPLPPSPPVPPNCVPAPAAPQEPQAVPSSHPPITVVPITPQDIAHGGHPRHGKKVSPAKAVGFSVLAAGSLGIAVLLIIFAVSRRRLDKSFHGGYLRGIEMSTLDWMREPPRLSAVAKPDREMHNAVITEVAEDKVKESPNEYAKTAGSSAHPSFKNCSMDKIAPDRNVQGSSESQSLQFSFTFFTVSSLQQYTNSFSDQNLVRETRFGKIYLAEHPESKFSVLKLNDTNAKMPADEFLKMVQSISELQHPNVEELVGCCIEYGQRLLIYKHFSDNTLDDMIHFEQQISDPSTTLQWDARITVALEAAKALEYLHEGREEQVVHQHFRPAHVLIGSEMRVCVSACGLAPFAPSGFALQQSDYCDVLSYEPPETANSAAWTAKGDIYSFGVVMLQLLTGRKPYDSSRPRGERHLVPWASSRLYDLNALRKMADPRLGPPAPVRSLSRLADIISRCIQQEAEFRPAMSQVAQDLKRALEDAHAPTHG